MSEDFKSIFFHLLLIFFKIQSHSGLLNGGHYISYACNPNGNWYCYNDSSCREVATENPPEQISPPESNNNVNKPNDGESATAADAIGRCSGCTPLGRRKNPKIDAEKSPELSAEDDATSGAIDGSPRPARFGDDLKDSCDSATTLYGSRSSLDGYRCSYSDVRAPKIDTSTAYILFYERSGLDYRPYLPSVASNGQVVPEVELEENESEELRKQLCSLQ